MSERTEKAYGGRTLEEALAHAEKNCEELPQVVQVWPSDWDIVLLSDEVQRLRPVVEAAVAWAEDFIVKAETNPIDDDLYLAVKALIAAREQAEKNSVNEKTETKGQP